MGDGGCVQEGDDTHSYLADGLSVQEGNVSGSHDVLSARSDAGLSTSLGELDETSLRKISRHYSLLSERRKLRCGADDSSTAPCSVSPDDSSTAPCSVSPDDLCRRPLRALSPVQQLPSDGYASIASQHDYSYMSRFLCGGALQVHPTQHSSTPKPEKLCRKPPKADVTETCV